MSPNQYRSDSEILAPCRVTSVRVDPTASSRPAITRMIEIEPPVAGSVVWVTVAAGASGTGAAGVTTGAGA